MRRSWICVFVPALLVCSAAPTARAQEPTDAAETDPETDGRAAFERGRSLYQAGSFVGAAEAFQQAYDQSQLPELLYNIYLAHRDAGNDPGALVALRAYLEHLAQDADNRPLLEERLRVLEDRVAARDQAEEASNTAAPADEGGGVLPLVLIVTGGALVAGGIVTAILSETAKQELEADCVAGRCPSSLEGTRDRGMALAITTDVLIGVGVVTLGVGVVLALLGGSEEDEAPPVTAGCGATGCMLTVRGQL